MVDCVLSEWSSWSRCEAKCPDLFHAMKKEVPDFSNTTFTGPGQRYRTRIVLRKATGNGRRCPGPEGLRQDVGCKKECRACRPRRGIVALQPRCLTPRHILLHFRVTGRLHHDGVVGVDPLHRGVPRRRPQPDPFHHFQAPLRRQGLRSPIRGATLQYAYVQCVAVKVPGCACTQWSPHIVLPLPLPPHCAANDCKVTEWSTWSNCSEPCGNGTRFRARSVVRPAKKGGLACPALREEEACNTQHCPVDCVAGEWEDWGNCSTECGGGVQTRRLQIIRYPDFGGKSCGVTVQNRTCNNHTCPVDCEMSEWSAWSSCSVECGGWGVENRTRVVVVPQAGAGAECPPSVEEKNCTGGPCSIDCEVTPWGDWGGCSEECGGGVQKRSRFILQRAQFGGQRCPPLNETRPCNEKPCPHDCIVAHWSKWSNCSEWCGNGTQLRTRDVLRHPIKDGARCPPLNETRPCFNMPCPQDCEVGKWSEWGECSALCGNGRRNRTRRILKQPENGGERCPALVEEKGCHAPGCPIDCKLGSWSNWTACEPSCGPDSRQHRTRKVLVPDDFGGKACPGPEALRQSRKCDRPCPADCEVGPWKAEGSCSRVCGGGKRREVRAVKRAPTHGGKACPALEAFHECNTHPCARPVVDTECSEAASCSECLALPTCGFSPSADMCMRGNLSGPEPLWSESTFYMEDPDEEFVKQTRSQRWSWIACKHRPCAEYSTAATCIGDPRCGWCSSDKSCKAGDDRGPSGAGSCEADAYFRWPGYHPRTTGLLRKPRVVVPTREHLVAYMEAEDDAQRLAVWDEATKELQHKEAPARTCTPCEGTWPNCDCSGLLKNTQFDAGESAF